PLPKGNELSKGNSFSVSHSPVATWQPEGVKRPKFGPNLKQNLDMRGISPAELARWLQVNPSAVSRWITKGTIPEAPYLVAAAKVLRVDPEDLLGDDALEPLPARPPPPRGRPPREKARDASPKANGPPVPPLRRTGT